MAYHRIASLALVTGASSGIGRAFARKLAAHGSDLILVARDHARLDELAGDLRSAHGRRVEILRADLTLASELAEVEKRLREDGRIDLLVNNAGYGVTGGFANLPLEDSQGQIDLNITALTRLAHAALTAMRPVRRGGIINIASAAGMIPSPDLAVYAATKAYVSHFSQALHSEVSGDGVTVTVVCPGFTRTEFQRRAEYDTHGIPEMAWQTAEQVVSESLDAYTHRRAPCIPGTTNRAMAGLLKLVPRSRLASVVARFSPEQATRASRAR